jgi:hypothetical protein
MNYIVSLIALFWMTSIVSAQQMLHLIYVDASEPVVSEDYFSDAEIKKMLSLVETLPNDGLSVFFSDGRKSKFIRGTSLKDEVSSTVYTLVPGQPDWKADRKKLRDHLFPKMNGFKGEVHLHFFLSDRQVRDVINGSNFSLKLLPRELHAVNRSGLNKVHVHVYYSNDRDKIDKTNLMEILEFYNDEFPPTIQFEANQI